LGLTEYVQRYYRKMVITQPRSEMFHAPRVAAMVPRGCDDGPDVSFPLSSPHGAVAIGDLALDDGRAKVALAGIVGRFDLTGPICEGKELLPGAGEPVSKASSSVRMT
jgi:hypothetical protein